MNIYLMKKPKRINSVSVTLFLLLVAGAYLGWTFGPVYWPFFQMTGIMRGVCNTAYREKNDDKLLEALVKEGRRTRLRLSTDNFSIERIQYSEEELLAAPEGPRKIVAERGKACVINFHYEDEFTWPVLERRSPVIIDRRIETPLEQVSWKKDDNCTCVSVPRGQ